MCSTNPNTVLIPYGLKVPNPAPYLPFGTNVSQMALDLQRAQFYDYSTRLQYGIRGYPNSLGFSPYHAHPGADPYMHPYLYKDPRARYIHEEPKPNHSYIGLIAMAILSVRDKKLVLSDIYQWILDNYAYFRTRGPGWRNSIRHNLSLNDCFIKSGRSANGKGHYWAIHPANLEDFQKGDFRRRRAQRRVRKHMGLSVPDDDDSPSPSPTSTSITWDDNDNIDNSDKRNFVLNDNINKDIEKETNETTAVSTNSINHTISGENMKLFQQTKATKKRLFDVESLLAPDNDEQTSMNEDADDSSVKCSSDAEEDDATLDVGTELVPEVNSALADDRSESNGIESSRELEISNIDKENMGVISGSSSPDTTPNHQKMDDFEKNEKLTDFQHQQLQQHQQQIQQNCLMVDTNGGVWRHGYKNFSMMASRPSAFHNARMCSWGSLTPYLATYPLVSVKGHYPLVVPRSNVSMDTAQKWQETVTQIVTNNDEKSARTDE